jgi:hypothetical protein
MRYLLDELTSYEEGVCDILLPDRAADRHETFMGSHNPSTPVYHVDLQRLQASLIQQFRELLPAASQMSTAAVLPDQGKFIMTNLF